VAVRPRGYEADVAAAAVLDTRLVGIGTWLFLAADIFFFVAWWFGFFYLRALNNDQAWKTSGAGPPSRGYGAIVLVLALATGLAYFVGSRPLTRAVLFRLLTPVALVFGLATCLFQGFEMWHLGFGLTEGGYPSMFAGLTGAWLIQFAFATAWLASVVMQAGPAGDTVVRRQAAGSFAWILLFLGAIGVVNYLLLYFLD
jgi:heme/copper-type cytochrome/quinol oxidase subunit 3